MKLIFSLLIVCSLYSAAHADTLTLTIDTVIGISGEQVEVSVKAAGFTNLAVLEGTVEWDNSKMSLVEVRDYGVDNLSDDNFGRPNGIFNKVTFTWTEPSNEGKSVPDSTIIFKLVFDVTSTNRDSIVVQFADTPLNVTAANNVLEDVTVIEQNGQVQVFPALEVSVSSTDVSCFGVNDGSIDLSATGASGDYSYTWTTGDSIATLSDLEAGTYNFTISDETTGHQKSDSVVISGPAAELVITLEDITQENDTLGSLSATIEGGTAPYSIVWSDSTITGDPLGLANGPYSISVTDENGCTDSDSIDINVELPSSLSEIELSGISIYPNPTSGLLTIDLSDVKNSSHSKWYVYNNLGQCTNSGSIQQQGKISLDLTSNAPGLHYLLIENRSFPIVLKQK